MAKAPADKPKSAPAPAEKKGGWFGGMFGKAEDPAKGKKPDTAVAKKPGPATKKPDTAGKKGDPKRTSKDSSGSKNRKSVSTSYGSGSGGSKSSSSSNVAPKKRFRSKYANPFAPRVLGVSDGPPCCPYPFCPPPPGFCGPPPGYCGPTPRPCCPPRPPFNYPYPPPWGFPPPPPPPGACPLPGMCPPSCGPCGPKTLIRVPKGQRPPFLPGPWGAGAAQPPSYNNCNFYTTPSPPPMSYPPPFLPPPPFMPRPPCMQGPGAGPGHPLCLPPPQPFDAHQGYGNGDPCCKPMRSVSPSLSLADSDFLSHLESLARSSSPLNMPNPFGPKPGLPPQLQNRIPGPGITQQKRNSANSGQPAATTLRKSL